MASSRREVVRALLETGKDNVEHQHHKHPLELCQELLILSREETDSDDAAEGRNVRTFLGNIHSSEASKLAESLACLMEDRVDTQELMPLTYDDEANQEAMENDAMTLTRSALVAAELYARLLSMPGALGAGLVQLQALSALTALMKRWRMECCGREAEALKEKASSTATTKGGRAKRSSRDVRPREDNCDDDDAYQPLKRSRRPPSSSQSESFEDEQDDDESDVELMVVETSNSLTPRQLVAMGLAVAREASAVPLGREFMSWSSDARESTIDLVSSVLGTASALTAISASKQHRQVKDDSTIGSMGRSVVTRASASLTHCTIRKGERGNDKDSDDLTKRHETSKFILRGLLALITMKDVMPQGEAGKHAAAANASKVLASFIHEVAEDVSTTTGPSDKYAMKTPARKTPSQLGNKTPMSTGSCRTMRVSLGGGSSTVTQMSTTITSPKLKSRCTASSSPSGPASVSARKVHPVLSVIVGMLQVLASNKEIEKASIRSNTVETLRQCIGKLPHGERLIFLKFLIQLSHSKVTSHRNLATELMGEILVEEWLWNEHTALSNSKDDPVTPSPKRPSLSSLMEESSENMPGALLGALQERLMDRIPAIRATSANAFSTMFRRLLLDDGATGDKNDNDDSSFGDQLVQSLSPRAYQLAKRLRGRCVSDDKATVRKAALSALVELLLVAEENSEIVLSICEEDLIVLGDLCCDGSLLVRKASAEALTRLLEWYAHRKISQDDCSHSMLETIEMAWVSAVLPLALDSENSCISKALELFDRMVLNPLLHGTDCQTSWRILANVTDSSGQQGSSSNLPDALRAVMKNKAISAATDRNQVLGAVLKVIHRVAKSTLEGDHLFEPTVEAQRSGVWCFFNATMDFSKDPSEITQVLKRKKIGSDFIVESWEKLLHLFLTSKQLSSESMEGLRGSMKHCLTVMSTLASGVEGELGTKCSADMERLLSAYSLPVDIIGPAVRALTAVAAASNDNAQGRQECASKIRSLLTACEDEIAAQVGSFTGNDVAESILVRALFTTGELSLVGFSDSDDCNNSAGGQPLRGLNERPTKRLVELVQAFLPKTLPGSDNVSPEIVRAHAFLALGKMCLRDEKLAVKSLNLLARELHENMNPAVQSNSLIILGDMCVRYTNLVDRFLPMMAACLQSGVTDMRTVNLHSAATSGNQGSALVRIHAIRLLSSLLIQDYIKWRGLLFHRFLVATSDEDDEVAATAEMILCGPLLAKQPQLFSKNFVESLFVLNRCTAHPIYEAAAVLGDGGSGIAVGFEGIELSGEVGRARRLVMYELMLARMTDEEKIGVTARIAKDVLGNALEEGSALNRVCGQPTGGDDEYETARDVLSDAFSVLSSKSIRVSRSSGSPEEEQQGDDPEKSSRQKAVTAKGRLLSRLSRKHLIEIVIPILVSMKALLQKRCSPLLKDLMLYLVSVYDMYKVEVKDLLSNDPSLLQEIEYDARQHKKKNNQNQSTVVA